MFFDIQKCISLAKKKLYSHELKSYGIRDLQAYVVGRLIEFFLIKYTTENEDRTSQAVHDKVMQMLDKIGFEHIQVGPITNSFAVVILLVRRPGILIGQKGEQYEAFKAFLGDAFVLQLEEVECSSIKLEKVLRNITGNWKRKDQMPDVVKEPFAVARFIFQPEDLHTAIVGTRELFIANNIDGTAVPEDVYSLRFAEWVCAQQELAFIAGCNMTKQLMEQDAAMAEYEKETEAQFQTLLNKQSVNQMVLNEGLRAFEKDTSDEVHGNDSDVSGTT